jgi:hypothetical protein
MRKQGQYPYLSRQDDKKGQNATICLEKLSQNGTVSNLRAKSWQVCGDESLYGYFSHPRNQERGVLWYGENW